MKTSIAWSVVGSVPAAGGGSAPGLANIVHGLLQFNLVVSPDALHSGAAVQVGSHHLVRLKEFVQLAVKLVVLAREHLRVVVKSVKLSQQISIVVSQGAVAHLAVVKLVAHTHHLVLTVSQPAVQIEFVRKQILSSLLLVFELLAKLVIVGLVAVENSLESLVLLESTGVEFSVSINFPLGVFKHHLLGSMFARFTVEKTVVIVNSLVYSLQVILETLDPVCVVSVLAGSLVMQVSVSTNFSQISSSVVSQLSDLLLETGVVVPVLQILLTVFSGLVLQTRKLVQPVVQVSSVSGDLVVQVIVRSGLIGQNVFKLVKIAAVATDFTRLTVLTGKVVSLATRFFVL